MASGISTTAIHSPRGDSAVSSPLDLAFRSHASARALATSCVTVGFFVQLHPSESSIDGVAVWCVRAETRDLASRSNVPARCARGEWFDDGKPVSCRRARPATLLQNSPGSHGAGAAGGPHLPVGRLIQAIHRRPSRPAPERRSGSHYCGAACCTTTADISGDSGAEPSIRADDRPETRVPRSRGRASPHKTSSNPSSVSRR